MVAMDLRGYGGRISQTIRSRSMTWSWTLAVCDTAGVESAVFIGPVLDRRSPCGSHWMIRGAFHGWYWSAAMPVWRLRPGRLGVRV